MILTDTNKLGLPETSTAYTDVHRRRSAALAERTDGVVVDVHGSATGAWRSRQQAATHPKCPYAVNLVAARDQAHRGRYRNAGSKYVVIAGNDDVIPFFRYPDTSGLGSGEPSSPRRCCDGYGRRTPAS